ncbi:hypothetical protein HXX76_009151 [Chlamydomonas incerta]|uniref:Protein kinase domain-containing protein n=1 Tax=Chlamydomonas incerta TaxID=51695 RepID=A0A835SRY3_CHLIN|nr:hypothetical protein HXX76_009151 [Chlamydomonas incerta]|eukprot:KAG2432232.1 hypothetical protein HXX76_009151 [Chlamydomonas incerta]
MSSDNVTAENGTATKFATELDLAGLSRVFVVPAGGSVTLQRLRLTGAALPAAPYPLPPASFLALSAFQLPAAPQPAPPLTLVDVEVVTPSCVALSLHQDFACRAAPSPNFTVSPGSLTVHRLVTASISLTNVRLSCSGAVPAPWPCLAAVVNSASQFLRSVASMTHTVADTPDTISQQFRPYLYVWLNSSMALADGLPDPGAVLRGFAIPLTTLRLSVAGPPDGATTLDLAGTGGLFPIDLYGSRIANVELANLTLRNPPPGPPEYGLFNLLRLLIWTFSFNRRIFTQKDFGPVLTLTNVRVEGVPREEVAMYAADAGPPLITYLSATGAAVPAAAANASVSGDVGSQAGASTTWPAAAALVPCLCAVDTGVFTSINASQVADPRDAIHIRTAGSLSKLTFYWNVTVALSAQPLPAPAGIGITAATAPDECPFGTDSFCNLEPMLSVSAGRSAHKWPFLYRAGTPANPYVVTAGSLQARSRSTESSKNTIPAVMVTSPVAAYTFDPDTDVVTYTRIERPYTLYGSASMRVMVDWRGVRALVRLQQSAGSSAGGSRRAGNGSSSGTGAGAAGVAGAVSGAAVSSRNASLTVRFLTMVGLAAATEPSPAPATLGSSNSSVASGGSSTTNQQQPAPGRRRRGRGLQQQQAGGSSRTSRMLLQLAAAAGNASSTSGGGSAEPTQGLPAAMGNFTSCVWAIRFDRAAAVEMAAVGSGGASSSSGGGGGGGALGDDLPYVFLDGVTLVVPAPELQLLAWALTERPEAVAAAVPDAGLAAQLAALAAGSALALRDAGSGGGNTSSNGHTGSSSDNSNNGSVDGVSSLELSRFRWCGLLGRNVTLTSRVPTPDDFAALSVEELAIMSGLTLPAALELSVQASSSSSSNTSAGASPIGNGTANGIDGVGGGGSNGSPSGAPAGPSPAPALLPPPPPRHWAVPPSPATTAGSRGNTPSGAPHPPLPAAGSSSTTTHTGAGTGAGGGAEATTGISRPEDGSGASSQARGIAIGAAVGCVALVSVVLLLVLYLFAVRRWRLREPVAWSSDKAISRADDGGCRSGCLDVWMPPAAAKGATGAEAAASGDGSGGCSTSSKYRRSAEGTRSTPSSFGCPAPIAGGDGAVAAGGGSGPAGAPGVSSASSLAVAMVELAQEPAAAEAAVAAAAQQPGAGEAAAALVLPSPSRSMVSLLRTMVSSPLSVSVSRLGRAAPAAPALGTAPRATTPPLSLSQSPPQLPPLRLARHHGGQQSPLAHTSRGGQSVTPRGFAALLATAPRGSLLPPSPAAPEPGSAQHSPTAAAAAAGSPTSRMAVATGSFRRLRTASVTSTAPSNTIQRALAEMYGSLHQTRLGVSAVHQHMEPHGTEASGGSWSQQQYRSTDFPSAGPGSPRVVLQAAAGSKLLAAAAAAVVGAAAHGDGRPSSMPQWGFLLREPVAQAQAQAAWLPARGGRLRPISAAAAAVWCGDVAATTAAGGRTAAAPHHQAHDVGGGAHRGLRQGRLLAACTDAAGGAAAAAGGCSGTEPGLSADLGAGDDGSADHTSSANGAQWAKHAAAAGVPLGSTAGPGARCAPAGATGAAGHGTSAGQKPPQPSHATAWGLSAAIGADATAAAGAGGSSTSGSGGGGSQGTPRSTSSVVAGATLASTGGASPRTGWGADASSAEPHLLTLTGELGRGAQGVVYRGLWRGLDVAVKSTLLQRAKGAAGGGGGGGVAADSDPRIRQAILEAAISASVSHPNVVATYTYMLQQLGEEPGEGGASSTSRSGSSGAADSVGGGSRGGVEVWKLTLVQELCDANSLRRKPGSAGRNSSNSGVGPEGSHGRSGDKSGSSSNSRLHRGSAVAASSDTRTQQPSAARPPLRDVVLCLALHIARGLEHLHSRGIVHGDVSSSNVLLQREGRGKAAGAVAAVVSTGGGGGSSAHTPLSCGFVAKVCDFGLSGRLDASEEQTHLSGPARRSSAYSAPELVRHGRSSPAGDVYAFAVVAWELAWGASLPTLLARPDGARMVAWLASQAMAPPADVTALPLGLLTWPPATPLELLALVGDCLREQAAARPSMHAVCQVLHGMT